VIATGPLGGREMSYRPEVELLYVYEAAGETATSADEFFVSVGCDLTAALRDDAHEGALYQVALPPWPQAGGSLKACSLSEYTDHYAGAAAAAERLALTRARPVAGDHNLGARFMSACHAFVYGDHELESPAGTDTSTAEFLTQMFQTRYGARHSALRQTGTLGALEAMRKAGLISEDLCRELDHAYLFLQSTEHRRQLGLHEDLARQEDASRERIKRISSSIRGHA
jgi:glutamate-ammonia-ligase adenylyltransferase